MWSLVRFGSQEKPSYRPVSKVLGHLSKPAAPTSVPGLLRQTLSGLLISGFQCITKKRLMESAPEYKFGSFAAIFNCDSGSDSSAVESQVPIRLYKWNQYHCWSPFHPNYTEYWALNLLFCPTNWTESTERCKFVRAKLRESFCPAAASHSRPRQAGA